MAEFGASQITVASGSCTEASNNSNSRQCSKRKTWRKSCRTEEAGVVTRTAGAEGRARVGERQQPSDSEVRQGQKIKQFEEHEEYQKIIVVVSEGTDTEVEQKMRCYLTRFQVCLGLDKGQVDIAECGIRRAVEARRRKHAAEQEQGKKVRFSEQEDQPEEMRAQSKDAPGRGSWKESCERRQRRSKLRGLTTPRTAATFNFELLSATLKKNRSSVPEVDSIVCKTEVNCAAGS